VGPGRVAASEQALAGRFNVSQGTVRKALDALAADSLIDRRQGKGTYVAEHTQERALFRFFRMARPAACVRCHQHGKTFSSAARRVLPRWPSWCSSPVPRCTRSAACASWTASRRAREDHSAGGAVPGLEKHEPLPNALYALYQREYGVNIVSTEESCAPTPRARTIAVA